MRKEKSQKQKLIDVLKYTIKAIEKKDDSLDVSCFIVQNKGGEYYVDVHEYL
jgi:hypothetical protein